MEMWSFIVRLPIRTFTIKQDTNQSEKRSVTYISSLLRQRQNNCTPYLPTTSRPVVCANFIQVHVHTIAPVCGTLQPQNTNIPCKSISIPITIIMKQQRQPNSSSSSSRVVTVLLLTIALPYLLFSRCSADESSSLIIDRHATTGLKEKQLQRRLNKINQKRIRQHESLLNADAPLAAAAAPGSKSSKAAPPPLTPRTAPPVAPPTYPPTISIQPTSKPSLSPTVSTQPSAKPSLSPTISIQPTSKPSLSPTVSTQPSSKPSLSPSVSSEPSSKPSLSPSVSSQPSFAPSKSGKSSPRSRRYD
eukprot:scaffold2549_cov150-Skeletonema_dohrnii-CCMP3373.AAC.3